MVGKYKAYPEYKDSGVKWLGKIPKHWEANKTKWYCKVTDGSHHSPDIQLKGYPFISVTDIGENKIDFCNAKKISKSDYYRLVREGCKPSVGDILLTKDGTIGRACLVNVSMPDFVILSSLGLLTPKQQVLNKFLYYYLISGINIDQMNSMIHGSALRRMTINKINELLFICPEISEQQNIANFLDYETSKIDMLIEKQQQLIKLLEEKRQAVISHAVTKGLNPNVSMKDSGVEWLGEIPEHWQIWKLAHAFEIIGSGTTPPSDTNDWYGDDINWVTTGELREDIILSTSKKIKKKTLQYFSTLKIYPKGTILIAMYGATIGRLGILGESATTNQACCALSNSNYLFNMYLFYWLISFRQEIIQLSSGGGQPNINQEKVAALKISTPTLEEQKEIISFLDQETLKLRHLIAKANKVIEFLKERRTALISAAVTGKIDVRDWQAPTVMD